jgi:hypothetical protein
MDSSPLLLIRCVIPLKTITEHLISSSKFFIGADVFPIDEDLLVICGDVSDNWVHEPWSSSDSCTVLVDVRCCAPTIDVVRSDSELYQLIEKLVEGSLISEQ